MVVCAVYFVPVAGYIPSRSSIKYLTSQRDMEVWFAPIGTSRVLVPYRISIPTPIGTGVMQATQFVSVSQPRAAGGEDPMMPRASACGGACRPQLSTAYPQNFGGGGVDSGQSRGSAALTFGALATPGDGASLPDVVAGGKASHMSR